MEDNNTTLFHNPDQDDDQAEEALSLCDLPLNDTTTNDADFPDMSTHARRSSSEPPDFFEFLSDISSEMSPAEDIILCGKLVPFKEYKEDKKQTTFRRRAESLSGLQSSVTRSDSAKVKLMRNSRSLDYQKLHRFSSSKASQESGIERNWSVKTVGKADMITAKKTVRPRWYLLMFGVVKPPAEMELKDIKSRQVRRIQATLFPSEDGSNKQPVHRSSSKGRGGTCRLLRALSCNDHASVAVAASFCV